jgi:hypothetical protein
MKRWLALGGGLIGTFAIGVFAGVASSRNAYAHRFQTLCQALFVEPANRALTTMTFIASGHPEWVYDVAEDRALLCNAQIKPEQRSLDFRRCAESLKAFYAAYPERAANLARRRPEVAQALGIASSP